MGTSSATINGDGDFWENYMPGMTTIVHGEPVDDETAEKIKKAYGLNSVIDDWTVGGTQMVEGALHLTREKPDLSHQRFPFTLRVVTLAVALEMVKIDEGP